METRKEIKKKGKKSLKRNYWIFIIACLLSAIIGSEFTSSLESMTSEAGSRLGVDSSAASNVAKTNMIGSQGIMDAIDRATGDKSEESKTEVEKKEQEIVKNSEKGGNKTLGRSRGVFAAAANKLTSGSVAVTIISGLTSMVGSKNVGMIIFIFLSIILSLAFWILIKNTFIVINRRIFLEGRTYEKIPLSKFLFLYKVKRWINAALCMLWCTIFQFLWIFTIIGWPIKIFSYYLIPYIVAENPAIPVRQSMKLSKKMMKGHKWECFVYTLSFLGWEILDLITVGIVGILYYNPYRVATMTEYYASIRKDYIDNEKEGYEYLNDKYLYEKADSELLVTTYDDIENTIKSLPVLEKKGGFKGFIANTFGVTLFNEKDEAEYEDVEIKKIKIKTSKNELEGKAYPNRLYTLPISEKMERFTTIHYLRNYSLWSLILMFLTLSFVGWLWEVSLHLISDGEFVNRGVLHGPWLPIYGTGGILILVLLNKLRKYPIAEFFATVVVCGCIEYYTAYYLELTHHGQKWWDYSGYFLNLDGRICAEGLLVFGLGGIAIVYFLAPLLDNVFRKIKYKILIPVSLCLLLVFMGDNFYSQKYPNAGKGITDYKAASAVEYNYKGEIRW